MLISAAGQQSFGLAGALAAVPHEAPAQASGNLVAIGPTADRDWQARRSHRATATTAATTSTVAAIHAEGTLAPLIDRLVLRIGQAGSRVVLLEV